MRDSSLFVSRDAFRLLLTRIQRTYVFDLANGLNHSQIAIQHDISRGCVTYALKLARQNTLCSTNDQLVAVAVRCGLLDEMWEKERVRKLRLCKMPPEREGRSYADVRWKRK